MHFHSASLCWCVSQLLLVFLLSNTHLTSSFTMNTQRVCPTGLQVAMSTQSQTTRKKFFSVMASTSFAGSLLVLQTEPTNALVKGSAPPEGYGKIKSQAPKEGASLDKSAEPSTIAEGSMEAAEGELSFTPSGVRFKDMVLGSGQEVGSDSKVSLRYRILRSGKRSYDGISGEGSLIFGLGYGEDDDKVGDALKVGMGSGKMVKALEDGLIGAKAGGVRRVLVRPDMGWQKSDLEACAPKLDLGATGTVPGAITYTEGCMDLDLLPSPRTFQAKRKLARRFDESLIAEIEVVSVE